MATPAPLDRRSLRERARRRDRRRTRSRAAAAAALAGLACGLFTWAAVEDERAPEAPVVQAAASQDTAGTAVAPVASAAGTVEPLTRLASERASGSASGGGQRGASETEELGASETEHLGASETEQFGASETEHLGASETEQLAPAPPTTRDVTRSPGATSSGAARPSAVPLSTSTGSPTTAAPPVPVPTAPDELGAAPQPAAATGAVAAGDPLAGAAFWVDPDSDAARAVASGSDPALAKIARAPGAVWLGDWVPTGQVRQRTAGVLQAAGGSIPVLVLYAVPGRDCGGYSSGGLGGPAQYRAWVREVAAGIGDRRAVVVLEPDALAQLDCLGAGARTERTAMLRDAVSTLAGTGATTYLDAGNSGWVDASTMAGRLREAGVAQARGFALNTSNFHRTSAEEAFGEQLSAALGGSHYVVDTSRNGNGPASGPQSWCNPAGRALGELPTTATRAAHADAYLWVKRVGESDGECGRGEPAAGTWWPQYALALARASA